MYPEILKVFVCSTQISALIFIFTFQNKFESVEKQWGISDISFVTIFLLLYFLFRYIGSTITLLSSPTNEKDPRGFCLNKIQPDCRILTPQALEEEAQKWVQLMVSIVRDTKPNLQPKDLRMGFKIMLELSLKYEKVIV